MKNKPLSAVAILMAVIIASCLTVHGQGRLDSLAGRFVTYIRSDKKEKIIILTDKAFYAAGETIWLKAWCLDSLSNRYIHASKNLYVDLVDDKDTVVSQLLFDLSRERTSGLILLPGNLKEGYYWLRGYTGRMLRQDRGRIFVKPVYILNANNPDPHAMSAYVTRPPVNRQDTGKPQLLFFPEGGSIIAGTTATVAFRCIGSSGQPLDVSGYVTDTRNDTVTRFSTRLPGIGKFNFDAFNPRKYFAHIKWKNNADLIYPLPHIDQYASQLSLIDQTDQALHMRVSLGDSLYKRNKSTYILGISRDNLCFAASGSDMYDVTVPKDKFPPGRATLYLFDDQSRMVSQRAIYIGDSDRVSVSADKPVYSSKEKVNLNIGVNPRKDGAVEKALFSVAITDERLAEDAPGLWMEETGSPEEIDLYLLTQDNPYTGWKFDADNMGVGANSLTAGVYPPRFDDSNLLNLTGRVVTKKGDPIRHYIVNLYSRENGIFQADTTDDDGHFIFLLPDYDDGTQFTMKLTNFQGKGRDGKVIMDKFNFPRFSTPRQLKKGFSQPEIAAIRDFKIHRLTDTAFYQNEAGLLKPVIVEEAKRPDQDYDKSKRVSQFSTIITSDKFTTGDISGLVNTIENIPGFNTGVTSLRQNPGGQSSSMGLQPMVVMDGVPQSISSDVKTYLQTLDANNIDFVEVLLGPQTAIYGVQGAGGVILINTNSRIKDVAQIDDQGLTTVYPKGYFNHADFTGPDYDKKETRRSAYPDQRSTLYWNANLITDNTGKANLNFFTASRPSTYFARIIGITESGEVVSKEIRIRCQ